MKKLFTVLFIMYSYQILPQNNSSKELANYFKEIKTVTDQNKNIWNYNLYAPMLFVDVGTRKAVANIPDSLNQLKKEGSIYIGVLPKEINIANTATRWNGVNWAMYMLPLPKNKKERICFLVHELFHRAQTNLGLKMSNPENNHLDQKYGRIYLRLELEALKEALLKNSDKDLQRELTNAFIFRQQRYETFPGADSTENLLELNEGIAEYTGVMMSGRNYEEIKSHFVKSINEFLSNPTFVRSFAYQTIPIYGYLLNKIKPDWNRDINSQTNLTKYFQGQFKVLLFNNLKDIIARIGDQYGAEKIISEEIKREQEIKDRILTYKKIFIEQPHLEIHFQNMNISFDPRNLIPLEDKGTVYPNLRITDVWGILTVSNGALMGSNWDKLFLSAPIKNENEKVFGDGWVLELKQDYVVIKDSESQNYVLRKR